jgi:hypothetical protein
LAFRGQDQYWAAQWVAQVPRHGHEQPHPGRLPRASPSVLREPTAVPRTGLGRAAKEDSSGRECNWSLCLVHAVMAQGRCANDCSSRIAGSRYTSGLPGNGPDRNRNGVDLLVAVRAPVSVHRSHAPPRSTALPTLTHRRGQCHRRRDPLWVQPACSANSYSDHHHPIGLARSAASSRADVRTNGTYPRLAVCRGHRITLGYHLH